ncbi:hypothetical protein DENSPDRAFT_50931 [Dentipellis sp. KUC8613]|nr:hypothetical protein DENSPDRAFT_50931 [Dentipellis sp. KUC8613]
MYQVTTRLSHWGAGSANLTRRRPRVVSAFSLGYSACTRSQLNDGGHDVIGCAMLIGRGDRGTELLLECIAFGLSWHKEGTRVHQAFQVLPRQKAILFAVTYQLPTLSLQRSPCFQCVSSARSWTWRSESRLLETTFNSIHTRVTSKAVSTRLRVDFLCGY